MCIHCHGYQLPNVNYVKILVGSPEMPILLVTFIHKRHKARHPRGNPWCHKQDKQETPFLKITLIHSKMEIFLMYGQSLQVKKVNKKVTAVLTLQTAPTGTLMSEQTHSHLRKRIPDLIWIITLVSGPELLPVTEMTFPSLFTAGAFGTTLQWLSLCHI